MHSQNAILKILSVKNQVLFEIFNLQSFIIIIFMILARYELLKEKSLKSSDYTLYNVPYRNTRKIARALWWCTVAYYIIDTCV